MCAQSEITWKRTNAKGLASRGYPSNLDILLYYINGGDFTWNPQFLPLSDDYIKKFYRHEESNTGRKYRLGDLTNPNHDRPNLTYEFWGVTRVWRWTKERIGYPTQKPLALLRRIIEVSSNEGDVVLDPFFGCATACIAAEQLSRQWVGIDISPKAAELIQLRMKDELGLFYGGTHRTDIPLRTSPDIAQKRRQGLCNTI